MEENTHRIEWEDSTGKRGHGSWVPEKEARAFVSGLRKDGIKYFFRIRKP